MLRTKKFFNQCNDNDYISSLKKNNSGTEDESKKKIPKTYEEIKNKIKTQK